MYEGAESEQDYEEPDYPDYFEDGNSDYFQEDQDEDATVQKTLNILRVKSPSFPQRSRWMI